MQEKKKKRIVIVNQIVKSVLVEDLKKEMKCVEALIQYIVEQNEICY